MRTPEKDKFEWTICLKLDVTVLETMQNAIDQTLEQFGTVDTLVNIARSKICNYIITAMPLQRLGFQRANAIDFTMT